MALEAVGGVNTVRACLLALAVCNGLAQAGAQPQAPALIAASNDECVILLHGLWRSQFSMLAVEWKLAHLGYQVVNHSYSSLTRTIQENARVAIDAALVDCRAGRASRISLVTHSLGGILIRQYLSEHRIPELGRVVMMGPPNQGSELADYYAALITADYLEPPALVQLGTGPASVPRDLGPVDFELGVIAGSAHLRSFLPGLPDGPGDGTLSVAETAVAGMADFIAMPVSHTLMMWDLDVLDQIVHFLIHGRFEHGADATGASLATDSILP